MNKNFDEFDGRDYSNMIDEAKTREFSALGRSKASRLRADWEMNMFKKKTTILMKMFWKTLTMTTKCVFK